MARVAEVEQRGPAPFFLVEIGAKTHPHDREEVFVSVNGEALSLHRQTPLPLKRCFVEALKNAVYPQYTHVPGEDRKRIGEVSRFPYRVLRRIYDEDEFNALVEAAKRGELTSDQTQGLDAL